jgi:argininosuccinate synthase
MCYELKTNNGCSEAVIDDNCGISKFYAIANTLAKDLKINFLNQIDDAETQDWDFQYRGQFLTLHYNIFNGVSIYPQQKKNLSKNNNIVMESGEVLHISASSQVSTSNNNNLYAKGTQFAYWGTSYSSLAAMAGATGKDNDQVRLERVYAAVDTSIKIIAPWKDPDFQASDRNYKLTRLFHPSIFSITSRRYQQRKKLLPLKEKGRHKPKFMPAF